MGNTVLAHHNYWGDDCAIPIDEYSLKYHPGGSYITLDVGPTCDKLYDCAIGEEDLPEEPHPCREEVAFRGRKKGIHDLMTQGFVELLEGNRMQAIQYLQPLVNINASKIKEMDGICRTDIYFAGLVTSKRGDFKEVDDSPLFRLPATGIDIYLNPTDTEFTIEIGEGSYSVSVYSTLGQLVERRLIFGLADFDVRGWEGGLYFVEMVNQKTGEIVLEKVVIE